ncbi:MAG: gamma-glutamyltransferase family protein [Truepera sp.]|nr:gamma-glutamyltransferase family protein [Truepera sp.]
MNFPYPSQRMPVMARNVVATSQPLAAQTGLRMLLKGGNAVDAAIAAAITLTVVEPTSNGIGSDAFCILWDGQALHGLNASGRSPKALTPERFAGFSEVPLRGWDAVTVPGAVSAWAALSRRFGRLPFEMLFEPAIGYARDGFMVSPITAKAWALAPKIFAGLPEFWQAFLPQGRAPYPGELFKHPVQARTLELIAASQGEAFYRGELAEAMAAHAKAGGGLLSLDDLASHEPEWCDPLAQEYHGVVLHELPPNSQGLAALLAIGILAHHPLAELPVDSADSLHLQLEAMKLALADAYRYIADPTSMEITAQALLEPAYLAARARQIDLRRAQVFDHGTPQRGGTVYLTAADEQGMMVSFIQSNYYGFGSGIVVPGTGISLQNRGAGFVLIPGHPNRVAGGKRPFHTIIPGFVTEQGRPWLSFGVMGGPMQPQGHLQMVVRLRDKASPDHYSQNPQAASDAPRWRVLEGLEVAVEPGFGDTVLNELAARGHRLIKTAPEESFSFGGAQLILRTDDGYVGASDHRKDGQAVGY